VLIVWFCVMGEMQKLISDSEDGVAPVVCVEGKKQSAVLIMTAQKFFQLFLW